MDGLPLFLEASVSGSESKVSPSLISSGFRGPDSVRARDSAMNLDYLGFRLVKAGFTGSGSAGLAGWRR